MLIQGLAPQNQFDAGYTTISSMADAVSATREQHDLYPVLFYFRYPEARYSAARPSMLSLDTVSCCARPASTRSTRGKARSTI